MKITLDHNCIIHLENRTDIGARIKVIVSSASNQCFVVNIGASEMCEKGVRPDNYQRFEELLTAAGVAHLPRLNPMGIFGVTFWNKCVWASDETIRLSQEIESVLFGNALRINIPEEGPNSATGKKRLNRVCDIHTMWCHIQNRNNTFLTTDGNFKKATKLPKLLALGAGRICGPEEL